MKLIAHRGLVDGPNTELENRPDQLMLAISLGFDCEIDLRVVDGKLWLGHDAPQYPVDQDFISHPNFWIHAKNLEALRFLSSTSLNYFWHQEDDYVITTHGYIWTYPEKSLTDKSIRLMPEWADPELTTIFDNDCYGICSDYVSKIRDIIPNGQIC
jgi:hypothetical protein